VDTHRAKLLVERDWLDHASKVAVLLEKLEKPAQSGVRGGG
jgi:hypothetical protein